MTDFPEVHVTNRAQLGDWFAETHATAAGICRVWWRSNTGREHASIGEVVEECLCFGWIDAGFENSTTSAMRLDSLPAALVEHGPR